LRGAVNIARKRARGLGMFAAETVRRALNAGRLIGAPTISGNAGSRAQTIEPRPRRGLTWALRSLLAASLTVPLLLLAIAAWQNYRLVQVQAEQQVLIEAGQLHEHALRAIETYTLVLAWIDDRIRGLDWEQIERDNGLHRFLMDIEKLPQIGAVAIYDGAGHHHAGGRSALPLPADVHNRDAFLAQRQRDTGIFVGREKTDPPAQDFDISRRRSTPDGSFDGVIIVAARPEYFSEFFSTVSRDADFSALLMRSDGAVLVRHPPLPGALAFSSDRPIMRAIAANPDRGLFWGSGTTDGIQRLLGYRRIEGYPIYVVFGIPTRGVLALWRANLVDYLLFAVPASLGLFCMALFAVRQLQQQKIATWRWRTTARRLQGEMSRRTRAEAELRQAQKMEALGQLTGGVAHDFNNLLTVLQGCLEMLSGRQQDQKLQARVDMALGTIERGEKLTRQLLAFARRQPLTLAPVDLNEVLRRMAELLARTVGSGIRIETDLAPDLWPVDADATQLELAVINLAINARDAMPEGGVLRVRTFNTTLPPPEPGDAPSGFGDFAGLAISDTGTGMPPEVLARAFEPFFTSKEPGKGTGLGLSMVYGFTRQLGGSATIRSAVGHGTTVTLLLPRSREPGNPGEAGATGLPASGSA
jgi:two-component system NtrC family sensor kinase